MLVAGALFAMVMVGVIEMNINSQRVARTQEINIEMNSIMATSIKVLSNPDSCMHTFLGLGEIKDKMIVPAIKNHGGKTIFTLDRKYGNNLLKITEIFLGELNLSAHTFNLHITFEKQGKGFYGAKTIYKYIPFTLEVDGANNLIKCSVLKK
jgi:hypothetical protein